MAGRAAIQPTALDISPGGRALPGELDLLPDDPVIEPGRQINTPGTIRFAPGGAPHGEIEPYIPDDLYPINHNDLDDLGFTHHTYDEDFQPMHHIHSDDFQPMHHTHGDGFQPMHHSHIGDDFQPMHHTHGGDDFQPMHHTHGGDGFQSMHRNHNDDGFQLMAVESDKSHSMPHATDSATDHEATIETMLHIPGNMDGFQPVSNVADGSDGFPSMPHTPGGVDVTPMACAPADYECHYAPYEEPPTRAAWKPRQNHPQYRMSNLLTYLLMSRMSRR